MTMSFPLSVNLQGQWQRCVERIKESAGADFNDWLARYSQKSPLFSEQLSWVCSHSEFVTNYICQNSEPFREMVERGELEKSYSNCDIRSSLQTAIEGIGSSEQLSALLRKTRNREMTRIIWRDFLNKFQPESDAFRSGLMETTKDVSALAEAILDCALDYLYREACEKYGTPTGSQSGEPQRLVILGMGKLGAAELNLSSDIDLIFAYPESGETVAADGSSRRSRSNQEFFERLGRDLIQLIDSRTAYGFVFRVDMRLRPFGSSGPLVASFDSLENYYQTQGRDWERFAMIKARPIAGDIAAGRSLMELLRPFTYRKYIDFSAIQALRDIKALIEQEVHRSGALQDVKKGAGGIREVEFIAQAFQLIRGGRDPRLQRPELLTILPLLEEMQLLPENTAEQLSAAYIFLRQVEHALQGAADQQTQLLPQDDSGQAQLAALMGFNSWQHFYDALDSHRQVIQQIFGDVVAVPQGQEASSLSTALAQAEQVWLAVQYQKPSAEGLSKLGFESAEQAEQQLLSLLGSVVVQQMQSTGRERLNALMPKLLAGCGTQQEATLTLQRVLKLVEAVARRSAYLLLLVENPDALEQLIRLFAASEWIATQLVKYPVLLDELLDPRTLYAARSKSDLADELRQQLLRVPEEDEEAQLEAMRYFKLSNSLRVAACEVTDALPLMKVSDSLTWIAEVLLEQIRLSAWQQMVNRYGEPGSSNAQSEIGFLIVGYGKLGGIELGYGSDLDLVFLYQAEPQQVTTGERSVDNATFFMRLGQRIIHLLTAKTASDELYEVDMRLRPSGNSGMLVTSIDSFNKYQRESAWVWEHQALVRARAISGSEELSEEFNRVRADIIKQPRDPDQVKQDVRDMRIKMAGHLNKPGTESDGQRRFHLKQGRGGIVDIEFVVQFAALAWAHKGIDPLWSDNIRLLESYAEWEVISPQETEQLIDAYKKYRMMGHRLQLHNLPAEVPESELLNERQQVIAIWDRLLGSY